MRVVGVEKEGGLNGLCLGRGLVGVVEAEEGRAEEGRAEAAGVGEGRVKAGVLKGVENFLNRFGRGVSGSCF